MTYEEALKMATARWAPAGATPEEIKDATLKVLGEEVAKEYIELFGK
jgi:hypothetical protein